MKLSVVIRMLLAKVTADSLLRIAEVMGCCADGPTKEEAPEFQSPERPPGSPAENGSFGAFSPPSWPGLDL